MKSLLEISRAIGSGLSQLQFLNLSDNRFSDDQVVMLCNSIALKPSIRVLNLSKNGLSDLTSEAMGVMISKAHSLTECYLSWNKFTQFGAHEIFSGVLKGKNLAVLDISWNMLQRKTDELFGNNPELVALGQNDTEERFFSIFEKVMAQNKKLVHLDLS